MSERERDSRISTSGGGISGGAGGSGSNTNYPTTGGSDLGAGSGLGAGGGFGASGTGAGASGALGSAGGGAAGSFGGSTGATGTGGATGAMGSGGSMGAGGESGGSGAGGTVDTAKQKATEAAGMAKEQLAGVAAKASGVTSQATEQAAGGLHKAAELLREKGGEGSPAGTVAEKLESASGYLQGTSSDEMVRSLESMVRSKPAQTLLVAAGAGFLLAKLTR